MSKRDIPNTNSTGLYCLCIMAAMALPIVCWIGSSAMEARAYERVTGKHVTTWDAMWLDLRVQEGAKP